MDVPFLVLFINFVVLLAKRGFNLFIFSELLIKVLFMGNECYLQNSKF